MSKEQVYDELINPLMAQIIEICKTHGIAMLANFAIPCSRDSSLQCTTMLPDETGENPKHHRLAHREIMGRGQFAAITITRGEKT